MKEPALSRFSPFDRFFAYLGRRSLFDRIVFGFFCLLIATSALILLWQANQNNLTVVPTAGGIVHEGMVGTPRFVNPALALTRVDHDLTALLYRSLMKVDSDGSLVPDLIDTLTIADDGKVYNIVLKANQPWHDETVITASDVAYTIGLIKDPELKSPLRGNWNEVEIEVINDTEFNLILTEAYTPFIENLTIGIMPKHLWSDLTPDELPFSRLNTEPVGSSPFTIAKIVRDEDGLITAYELEPFIQAGSSNISGVTVHFYPDETALVAALDSGVVTHTAALSPETVAQLSEAYTVSESVLPRVFAGFINQNRSVVLRDEAVRAALNASVDRVAIIDTVLDGYGQPLTRPVPDALLASSSSATSSNDDPRSILIAGGWEQDESGAWQKEIDDDVVTLAFTIASANNDFFSETAAALESTWTALGMQVRVELYEQTDLVQSVIRPRDYELLLFGTDIGRGIDLYPFWHSSQREDPGLNVTLYTNITADTYLESYRTSTDPVEQQTLLADLLTEIETDQPAIFLFTPTFTYVSSADAPPMPPLLARPADRFAQITEWYLEAESVWPLFAN